MTRALLDQKDDKVTKIYLLPDLRAEVEDEQEKLRLPDRIEWQWSNG